MTKAWETRRRKYGPKGHASPYYRSQREADKVALERCRVLIARLHNEGILSEGQASRATGLDRVSLRALCDDLGAFEKEAARCEAAKDYTEMHCLRNRAEGELWHKQRYEKAATELTRLSTENAALQADLASAQQSNENWMNRCLAAESRAAAMREALEKVSEVEAILPTVTRALVSRALQEG